MRVNCIGGPTQTHCTFNVSEVQPKLTCRVSFSSSFVHRLILKDSFLSPNSHINKFVCVLTLGNLDVLGLLVDLLLVDKYVFSALSH